MKQSRNILAAISVLAVLFTACGKGTAPIRIYSGVGPNWYNVDISLLPIADDPAALAEVAMMLSQRYAPEGQKYYAFRLAERAYDKAPGDRKIALAYAHTAYLIADIEPDEDRMVDIAEKGLQGCRKSRH